MLRRTIRSTSHASDPFSPPTHGRQRHQAQHDSVRVPRSRRGLPDGRAVVGGLLVAVATLGTWWVTAQAGRAAPARYVVATRAIDPGHRIEDADLRLTPIDLPPSVARTAFTELRSVVGTVALGPIGQGGLLSENGIAPTVGSRSGREISFAVETPWAVDGALRAGDRIDVFATAASGTDGETTKVLAGAVVRHLSASGGGLGESTGLTITVAVGDVSDLDRAVNELRIADLTVVRATGVAQTESSRSGNAADAGRGDPTPSPSTTSVPTRSTTPKRSVTTTTLRPGAGS